MRWPAALPGLLAIGISALLGASSPASGQSVDRVQVPTGGALQAGVPPGLSLVLTSPREYAAAARAGESGRWVGPRYVLASDPGVAGNAVIEWSVSFDNRSRTVEQAAEAGLRLAYPLDQRQPMSVPHLVARREVGALPAHYILTIASNTPENARAEGIVAFPLAQGLFAVARFVLPEPPSDLYRSNGVVATSYNRGQAFVAFAGIRLEGNLAPKVVSIRAVRGERRIRGRVADGFRHAVVGASVTLQRRAGSGWRGVAAARTDPGGSYAFRTAVRGRYRVAATLAGTTVVSPSVGIR